MEEPRWAECLRQYLEGKHPKSAMENGNLHSDREADIAFLRLLEQEHEENKKKISTYEKIPRFFFKKPQLENPLYLKLRQEARTRFLHNKSAEVLDKEDLEQLWYLLKENTSFPDDGSERVSYIQINYDQFCYVASQLPPKCRQFFQPSVFLKCDRDEYGRIEIVPFFHYIVRKVNLHQTRIQISLYDSAGYGYLKEKDLENFIFELIPSFPQLNSLQESFYPYYVITAVRKFFFFLDPKKTGKIWIKDMLTSPILAELYELRQERWPVEEAMQNWFSVQSTLKVYESYLKLDKDQNGMLKKAELAKYSGGLTDVFVDRLFEEYQTFEGEMDYKTYLDFVLAMENKKTLPSLQYFWKILDVFKKGAIDTFVINMFFRAVIQKLEMRDKTGFRVEDVTDEIWDMAKPKVPFAITIEDLINCGQGDIVVSMLIDAKAFYEYDQRESGGELDDFDEFY
jgi:serine/threonine-protein phosphatase 2A regulatory subunit B''